MDKFEYALTLSTIEKVLPMLSRETGFSNADAKNGFWYVALKDESSRLNTFDSSSGRFC